MAQEITSKETSFGIIRQQKVIIIRLLNDISLINNNGSNLIESFKHFNILLMELKNNNISPKDYYEIYIEVYDCLTILLNYLKSNHLKLFHLTDIYELIQYSNNLVPRLYLMITCGVAMLDIHDFPHTEILKDMIEMLNGVQNPVKGMFLRYYLLQRCKFIFKNEDNGSAVKDHGITTIFKLDFLIANFIEMNKLWIRLQYQGHFKEKLAKLKERKEVELLIGYNLVQITEVLDLEEEEKAITLYKENTLPRILKQIISCRDIISQEYLLDIIIQIFPESYHTDLQSIDLYLDTLLKLTPKTNISKSAMALISRILSNSEYIKENGLDESHLNGDLIFAKFFTFLKYLNEERPDLPFKKFLVIILELVKLILVLSSNEKTETENLNNVFRFVNFKIKDYNITEELNYLLKKIVFSLKEMNKGHLYFKLVTDSAEFTDFVINLKNDYIKYEILQLVVDSMFPEVTSLSIKNLAKLLKLIENNNFVILQKPDVILRVFCLIISSKLTISSSCESLFNDEFETLQFCKNWLLTVRSKFIKAEQWNKVDNLLSGLIAQYWKLLKKVCLLKCKKLDLVSNMDQTLFQQIFKNLGNLIFELKSNKEISNCLLSSANIANQLSFFAIANDYIESYIQRLNSDFSIIEKHDLLLLVIQYIQKEREFFYKNGLKEKYEQFSIKLTVISFDLPDVFFKSNCLLACTHLWWTSLTDETTLTNSFENNPKRIHEVINKLLKYVTSNNLISNFQLCFVLLEVLNKIVYFFIHGELEYFTVNYLNNTFKLLKNNLRFLERENKLFLEQQQNDNTDITEALDMDSAFLGIDGSLKSVANIKTQEPNLATLSLNEDTGLINFKKNLLIFQSFENLKEYVADQGEVDQRFNLLNI